MTIEKIITPYNRDVKSTRDIKYLVFHYTGTLAAALNNAKYYAGQYVGASAHYYLDEKPVIYQGVEDKDVAWHVGNKTYIHPDCRNGNSIGIEMVPKKVSTKTMYASDTDWYFDPKTVDNAVALGRMLMKKHNIPIERVLRHYDVTGKICPNPFAVDAKAKAAWEDFKARLKSEAGTHQGSETGHVPADADSSPAAQNDMGGEDDMSYETFCGHMKRFEDERAAQPVDAWAKDAWDKAVAAGVFDGSAPLGNLTREQAALVLARMSGVTA